MNWQEQYRRKNVAPEEAMQCMQSGMRVYIHPGCAEPEALVEALIEIAHPKFRDELYAYCEKTRWLQRPTLAES